MPLHDTVEVPLTQGKVALIDAEDAERVLALKWHAYKSRNTWYAKHSEYVPNGNPITIRLHRFILGVPEHVLVDHVNRDGLDCRRRNLREAGNGQNVVNQKRSKLPKSGFRGVYRGGRAPNYCWYAKIGGDKNRIHIGTFPTPEEAARAWDKVAREVYGEFAVLNFPDDH